MQRSRKGHSQLSRPPLKSERGRAGQLQSDSSMHTPLEWKKDHLVVDPATAYRSDHRFGPRRFEGPNPYSRVGGKVHGCRQARGCVGRCAYQVDLRSSEYDCRPEDSDDDGSEGCVAQKLDPSGSAVVRDHPPDEQDECR